MKSNFDFTNYFFFFFKLYIWILYSLCNFLFTDSTKYSYIKSKMRCFLLAFLGQTSQKYTDSGLMTDCPDEKSKSLYEWSEPFPQSIPDRVSCCVEIYASISVTTPRTIRLLLRLLLHGNYYFGWCTGQLPVGDRRDGWYVREDKRQGQQREQG